MAVDVLVTGAAGALGSQITFALRSASYNVIRCGRSPAANVDAHWDISCQDRPRPDCNPKIVVHAAAVIGSYGSSLETAIPQLDVNVTGTMRVVRWCQAQGVEKLVLISGAIVYGRWNESPKTEDDPLQPWWAGHYAVSKWCSEGVASLFESAEGRVTILRLTSLYGMQYGAGLIPRLLNQGLETGSIHLEPPFDDGFDLLHLQDAAQAVRLAVDSAKSGIWNVGGGNLASIREVAELCATQANATLTLSDAAPERAARIINWVDDSKARQELGHTNQVSLNMGITEITQSLQTKGERQPDAGTVA